MGLLSLSWFRSEKSRELEELKVEEQKLKNQILEKDLALWNETPVVEEEVNPIISIKPWRRVKLVNDTLTIVLNDNSVITKPNATQDDFNKAREAKFESELLILCDK